MSLFSRIFGGPVEGNSGQRDGANDFWFRPIGLPTSAGVPVTVENAITFPVVYDCLKVLSDTVGALPHSVFERQADGSKKKQPAHPIARLFDDPNPDMTSVEFIGQMVWDLAAEGNHFSEMLAGTRGPFSGLERLEPKYVTVERMADRSRRFRYAEPGLPVRYLDESQVWHIKVTPTIKNGLIGQSPIMAGREAISAALALQDYAARFFRNDATPPYAIGMDGNFKDTESKGNFLAAIKRWVGGANRHSPLVLEYGMKPVKIGTTNDEAQFLETKKEQALDCCRIWRMPPHKVGILDRATFSNIEQQSLEFVIDTLLPWLRLIEKSVNKYLIGAPREFFFEFNVAGLLRGDIESRYAAYAVGRNWGWLSVNEIRSLENMNGLGEDGDVYLEPMNMREAGNTEALNGQPRDRSTRAPRKPAEAASADQVQN